MRNFARSLAKRLPSPLKLRLKWLYYGSIDLVEWILGKRNAALPPKRAAYFVGKGDFGKAGEEFLGHFVDLAGLMPDWRVLDVGCGIGRMAYPLTHFLCNEGEYLGFDVSASGIAWCRKRIATQFRNFHFEHADIKNGTYNPAGRYEASQYRFPADDGSFDFVFLSSVLTHMLEPEVKRYVAEVARVMKPGGRCLATFFVLNRESRELIAAGKSTMRFSVDLDGCWSTDEDKPTIAIGYDENYVRGLYERNGLLIQEPIRFGSWCGREKYLSYQDIVIASKG